MADASPQYFVGFDLGGTKMLCHVYKVDGDPTVETKASAFERVGRERIRNR